MGTKTVTTNRSAEEYAPIFAKDEYSEEERKLIAPFFTNLDKSVYAMLVLSPELAGALCSRMSRAADDVRKIYLKEFTVPFLNPVRTEKDDDNSWKEKVHFGNELRHFIEFLQEHPITEIFSNPRARSFYFTWLAQYGDDSIAQMAGMHLAFSGISQLAIKHIEDQRIGIAPIEKSTRYVNYSKKVNGRYLYYTDPTLGDTGLKEEYERAMDGLFDTYSRLITKMIEWLTKNFPDEKPAVIEKKALDTLRGLLPTSTLSQVSFFGNGQAFEYLMARSLAHPLGEIRWAASSALEELNQVAPSFFRRLVQEDKKELAEAYQEYLSGKGKRTAPFIKEFLAQNESAVTPAAEMEVRLVEHDPEGENKVIAGMLFSASGNHHSWNEIMEIVRRMNEDKKRRIVETYLQGRTARWQKVGRAFEHCYNLFEIVMNIGAWRDLHRHRMLTQQRQNFSCFHGYDIPKEIVDAGLEKDFSEAIKPVEGIFHKISKVDPDLAQYAVTLAHRVRFIQRENMRQSFWQIELRTIPEGHPDYRHVMHKKFQELKRAYPLLSEYILVNLGEYDFARRGQEKRIQKKMQQL